MVWTIPILHVYACLLLCFMLVLASLVLGLTTFNALSGFMVVRLHPMPTRPCLGVTTWDASLDAGSLRAYSSFFPLHAMLCLPCLFVPPVGFLCMFTRLLTCLCMSLACYCVIRASIQWHYGHSIQTYICPSWTPPFIFFSYLFTFSLVHLLSCSLLAMFIMLICFMSPLYALCIFSFHCLSAGFLSLPLHVHTRSKDAWS